MKRRQDTSNLHPRLRTFFATAPKGLEPIVASELASLGAKNVKEARGGASFSGTLETAYRACLWLRTANRVLMQVGRFPATTSEQLYNSINEMPWERDLIPDGTLAVDFTGSNAAFNNTQFGAQRVKDAIVDRFRQLSGRRPSVDRVRPDVRVNCYLHRDIATVSLDLSGESLHMRGYRRKSVTAPLKETLAAALLLKCDWPNIAKLGGGFIDPMCGSGTIVIEAAMIAADIAPGLGRDYWGFSGWQQHDVSLWESLVAEAASRRNATRKIVQTIIGSDGDASAILASQVNARAAGVAPIVRFVHKPLQENTLNDPRPSGLMLTNPPYGERLGTPDGLEPVYRQLGEWLLANCKHWRAGVITDKSELAKCIGLRARKINSFFNGSIECKLFQFEIEDKWLMSN